MTTTKKPAARGGVDVGRAHVATVGAEVRVVAARVAVDLSLAAPGQG
jgi:hypothetical protein